MPQSVSRFLRLLLDSLRDLAPIIAVIAFFQLAVLRQPLPDLGDILIGLAMVIVGLALFVRGLEMALFPIGEALAAAFTRRANLAWLLIFAFALGFGTTVAEPALIAVTKEAAGIAAVAGVVVDAPEARADYATYLRITVAISVGVSLVIGVFRILKGWPLHILIIPGYAIVVVMTFFAPEGIIGIAYDSGGVTTSTITVPLVTAFGVGLAHSIRGRNPITDGFGLIAFASLTPLMFVMAFGIAWEWGS